MTLEQKKQLEQHQKEINVKLEQLLTDEQKKQLAEVDSRFKARVAEKELFLKGEIQKAQQVLWKEMRIAAEPGGAATFAALLSKKYKPVSTERVGVVVCGGNTDAVDFTK